MNCDWMVFFGEGEDRASLDIDAFVVWIPLRFTVLGHVLRDNKRIKFFQNTHHLRLDTLNGSVDVSTFDVEF